MSYSLNILWHERLRFLPGVVAVAFSTLLIALQVGVLLGMFSLVSIPVDRSRADLWVGYPGVPSVDLGHPIPETWRSRLAGEPEIQRTEILVEGFVFWGKRRGGVEMCLLFGYQLEDGGLGAIDLLTPELRERLAEPGSVVVDESEVAQLGFEGVGDVAEVSGQRVRLVGTVRGIKAIGGVYVFASVATARMLLRMSPDQATYVLAQCRDRADAPAVSRRLRQYENMSAFTSEELSLQSRLHWLVKTKAGVALGCVALLGLLVGAAVTSQTLYAATVAAQREFAVLKAMGIATRHLAGLVVSEAFWVGILGIGLALPAIYGLASVLNGMDNPVLLPIWLLATVTAVTLATSLLSGLIALRSLGLAEPAHLLR